MAKVHHGLALVQRAPELAANAAKGPDFDDGDAALVRVVVQSPPAQIVTKTNCLAVAGIEPAHLRRTCERLNVPFAPLGKNLACKLADLLEAVARNAKTPRRRAAKTAPVDDIDALLASVAKKGGAK